MRRLVVGSNPPSQPPLYCVGASENGRPHGEWLGYHVFLVDAAALLTRRLHEESHVDVTMM